MPVNNEAKRSAHKYPPTQGFRTRAANICLASILAGGAQAPQATGFTATAARSVPGTDRGNSFENYFQFFSKKQQLEQVSLKSRLRKEGTQARDTCPVVGNQPQTAIVEST
jgi:hypothetical protein